MLPDGNATDQPDKQCFYAKARKAGEEYNAGL